MAVLQLRTLLFRLSLLSDLQNLKSVDGFELLDIRTPLPNRKLLTDLFVVILVLALLVSHLKKAVVLLRVGVRHEQILVATSLLERVEQFVLRICPLSQIGADFPHPLFHLVGRL